MTRSRKAKPPERKTFLDLLIPNTLIFCEDYIVSNTNKVSYLKTIEILRAEALPLVPERFVLAASLFRNPSADINTFSSLNPEIKVVLRNPSDAMFELGVFPVSFLDPLKPWAIERLIIEFAKGDLQFNSSGGYTFQLLGRIEDQEFTPIFMSLLPVAKKGSKKKSAKV